MIRIFRLLIPIFVLTILGAFAQKHGESLYGISGRVVNADTGDPVAMATFVVNGTIGAVTDQKGLFRIDRLKRGTISYHVSFLGYAPVEGTLQLESDISGFQVALHPLSLGLEDVVVTARPTGPGSTSTIGENAIRHIQPMSIGDLFQLLPGHLSENPDLSHAGQLSLREIGTDANNSLGAAMIVDGAPLSNDGNLQALSPSLSGSRSGRMQNGMDGQTTAGRGVDLRMISPDNVESIEVIRGIPSAEYGNLTSGVVLVKTKAGATPWEAKFKADPHSKMVYAGKGFALRRGDAINAGLDWTRSFGDTRKRYLGYDRLTASLGYSTRFDVAARPMSLRLNGSFYSNVNSRRTDPQMQVTNSTFESRNCGLRLNGEGIWRLNGSALTALEYGFMVSQSFQSDRSRDYVASSSSVVTDSRRPGVGPGTFLPSSYYSDYRIEGRPLGIYLQLKCNRLIQFRIGGQGCFTNLRGGIDWRYDANHGRGLLFDLGRPPQSTSSQALRPRSFRDIPASNLLALFVEDRLNLRLGGVSLAVQGGLRLTNMFLSAAARRGDIFVSEPRVNFDCTLYETPKGTLSVTGGWGISYKMPTLLHLYPDDAYFDRVSLAKVSNTDPTGTLGLMTTDILTDLANPHLRPARSRKYEIGLMFRVSGIRGSVTCFRERHSDEFGFSTVPHYMHYTLYEVPSEASNLHYSDGQVTYTDRAGHTVVAATRGEDYIATCYRPSNVSRTEKQGVEYSLDLGQWSALRTSLVIDGAWLHIRRTEEHPYYSKVNESYDFVRLMPSGRGTEESRVNTNFRIITHLPRLKMIFSTTMQVVWHESLQQIWQDSEDHDLFVRSPDGRQQWVMPVGFYDGRGHYTPWQPGFEEHPDYVPMVVRSLATAYDREHFRPWVMFNFRLTKEIGRFGELSFTANNFTRTSRWHYYATRSGYKQIYPDMYFGAELKLRIGGR